MVPCTRDEHVSLLNSRKLSKSLPDLTSSVTMMTLIPTNLFHHDPAIDSAFSSITSPVKFVEHPVDDALPTAVPKPTNTNSSGSNEVTSKDCPESLSIPNLNNTNHLSKSDTSAFRTQRHQILSLQRQKSKKNLQLITEVVVIITVLIVVAIIVF